MDQLLHGCRAEIRHFQKQRSSATSDAGQRLADAIIDVPPRLGNRIHWRVGGEHFQKMAKALAFRFKSKFAILSQGLCIERRIIVEGDRIQPQVGPATRLFVLQCAAANVLDGGRAKG